MHKYLSLSGAVVSRLANCAKRRQIQTLPGSPRRRNTWLVASLVLLALHAIALYFAMENALANHFGGFGSSVVDGFDLLGMTRKWEIQLNLPESRFFMYLINWGFYPSAWISRLIFGDTWSALHFQLGLSFLTVTAGGLFILAYAREVMDDDRASFFLTLVYLLLPASFGPAIGWYGQPVFIHLMVAIYLMKYGYNKAAIPLVVWAHACHPMAVPAFLALACSAFRMNPAGRLPILPGLDVRDSKSRRSWKYALWTSIALAVWTLILLIGSRTGDSSANRDVLWSFFTGKFSNSEVHANFVSTVYFFVPLLFVAVVNRTWLPFIVLTAAYMTFASQGVVTGFSLPAAVLSVMAAAHGLATRAPVERLKKSLAAVAVVVLMNLFVPWAQLFPLTVEPLTGGLFAPGSWMVNPEEQAIDELVSNNIPEGTPRCLSSWQLSLALGKRCQKVTTLTNPFRREPYDMNSFLELGDRGRILSGHWDFILVDLKREKYSTGLEMLLDRIRSSDEMEIAGRTNDTILFKKRGSASMNSKPAGPVGQRVSPSSQNH